MSRTYARKLAAEVYRRIRYFVRKNILRNANQFDEWFQARGDQTLSISYPLQAESIVVEVGGYNGTWSSKIAERYNPHIYAFEPVKSFYSILCKRFENNPKVKVFRFGLSDQDESSEISLCADGSSVHRSSGVRESIQLRDIDAVIEELGIPTIDLIQINIEGGGISAAASNAGYRLDRSMCKHSGSVS